MKIGDIIKGMNMTTTPEPPGEQTPEEREAEWKRQEEERRREQAAYYGVFEHRAAHLKPIIATMNTTGDMLLARMTETGRADRGEPLIRRMREFCEIITF